MTPEEEAEALAVAVLERDELAPSERGALAAFRAAFRNVRAAAAALTPDVETAVMIYRAVPIAHMRAEVSRVDRVNTVDPDAREQAVADFAEARRLAAALTHDVETAATAYVDAVATLSRATTELAKVADTVRWHRFGYKPEAPPPPPPFRRRPRPGLAVGALLIAVGVLVGGALAVLIAPLGTGEPAPSATATPEAAPAIPPTVPSVAGDALRQYDDNGNGRITCSEAQAHGIAPVRRGHPAYPFMDDRNGDGVVCE